MYILGISCYYHDAAACLLKDGTIVAAAEEERFTRKKHDNSFPLNAVDYCLKEANISIENIDYIAFYEKPLVKFDRILQTTIEYFPKSFWQFYNLLPSWVNEKLRLPSTIKKKIKYKKDILFVPHHYSHAASAFLVSQFKKAAIVTVDAVGEWTTTSICIGNNNKIKQLKKIDFPNSLGLLYSTVTAYLGFKVNNDEYKIMGLSAYGKPCYYNNFKKIIDIQKDGGFSLNMKYFSYPYKSKMYSKKFEKEFGKVRKPSSEITQRHKDISASIQKITEEVMLKIVNHAYQLTKSKNLCLAGGVALNCLANGKIIKQSKFENIYVQPAATDAGGSLGAAFYTYNSILNKKRNYSIKDVYLGPGFSNKEIKDFLTTNNINFKEYTNTKLIKKVAKLLANDKIIGWFQGRMEFGPRALGNRSILASPIDPKMKDIMNNKVKHREPFRPFAPAVLSEKAKLYLDTNKESPFMTITFKVKKDKRKIIPAVTHVDGTARIQTVSKKHNFIFYNLIKEFEKLTKIPVLLNTSFNVKGEPIVCTPQDAYNCFANTKIDYLVLNNFLIRK